jgi:hypothetical protein
MAMPFISCRRRALAAAPMLVLTLCASSPGGECQVDRLAPSIHGMDDSFSLCAALRHDVAILGAPKYDGVGFDSGAAFVFRRGPGGWEEEAILLPSDPRELDKFGADVDIGDGVILVGADQHDADGPGAAYVYRFDGESWVEEARLAADDGRPRDLFGVSVALSGNWALIGAPKGVGHIFNGEAYLFRYTGTGWLETQMITPADGATDDRFGFAVALSGPLAVVGSPYDDDLGNRSGSAYVYRNDAGVWVPEAKLLAWDGAPDDLFGEVVAIDGDVVAVSSVLQDVYSLDNGAVYVFRRAGGVWIEEAKLVPPTDDVQENFGTDVAIDGDVILVGNNADCHHAGAYLFRFDGAGWGRDGSVMDQECSFGWSVAVSDGSAVVGAPAASDGGTLAGVAYAYDIEWCDGDLDCDGAVDFHDLLNLLLTWGDCTVQFADCSGDLDGDGMIDFVDLLIQLDAWGPCG